jgi:sugar/nucleoside kinase (ribokinase family)
VAADFLAVGHVVKDMAPTGWRLGGSVAYASLQASRLGLQTAAVTACAPDISPAELLPRTQWHVLPSDQTTTFQNTYEGGERSQRVLETGRPIGAAQIPRSWRSTPIVLFAPVFWDVDVKAASVVPEECLVGLGVQGWLRRMEGGRVRRVEMDPDATWLIGDIVFVSEEDVDEPERTQEWLKYVPMVVLTRGPRGLTIFDDDGRHDFPPFPATEIDATGAGDVFAAAFLVRWKETGVIAESARFAAAAASLVVQGLGLDAVPDRAAVESLLSAHAVGGQR